MSCDDDAFTGSASDGDISSTDLSVEELGAKETGAGDPSPPELGDAPPLLSGYSQTYVVRKQDPERNEGRNRQVTKCRVSNKVVQQPWPSRQTSELLQLLRCRSEKRVDARGSQTYSLPQNISDISVNPQINANPVRGNYLCLLTVASSITLCTGQHQTCHRAAVSAILRRIFPHDTTSVTGHVPMR